MNYVACLKGQEGSAEAATEPDLKKTRSGRKGRRTAYIGPLSH